MIACSTAAAAETRTLGGAVAAVVDVGDVVVLVGDLGAGKTCLTQGLARGLGVPAHLPVVSPSYTLANEYLGRIPLYHLDVYRIMEEDFFQTGLDEYFFKPGVTVVEWAEKIQASLPEPRLDIELTVPASGGRKAVLVSVGPEFEGVIREVLTAFAR